MVQLELQVLDKNGNVLETIYPVINNLAPQKAGWTQRTIVTVWVEIEFHLLRSPDLI